MTHLRLLAGLAGLAATCGVALWLRARRATRLAAKRLRRLTGTTRHFGRTVLFAVGLCGLEWLVATYAHDWRVLLAVFCLPSLFAGDSLARLVAVAEFARGDDL